jgi:cell division transport system permease protein
MKRPDHNTDVPRGASTTSIDWHALFDAWRSHHRETARSSLRRMLLMPFQTLLTAMVIGITLALPTLFSISLDNLQAIGKQWDSAPRLSVFLKKAIPSTDMDSLKKNLESTPGVATTRLVTPEDALLELEQQIGIQDMLELLDENPLPYVLVVTFTNDTSVNTLEQLTQSWQAKPGIESVEADLAWIRKLHVLLEIGQHISTGLAALLGMGALLSIGNTIRLEIESCRPEIVVAKLVGATDTFVRRPFLYAGFWYGLAGGLIANILVASGFHTLSAPVAEITRLYSASFTLQGLDFAGAAGLIAAGAIIGMLGAWLAVGQHLHDMRPR